MTTKVATLISTDRVRVDIERARIFASPPEYLVNLAANSAIVVSPTVNRLYGDDIRRVIRVPADRYLVAPTGEHNKTLASVERLLTWFENTNIARRDTVIAIGGGILLDLAGMAGSTFRRGVPVVKVGTTLLAQVDAAVGAKNAVNSQKKKNVIGSFYAPEKVFVDSHFLKTLPYPEIKSGLAEMVKVAIICDSLLYTTIRTSLHLFQATNLRTHEQCELAVDMAITAMVDQLSTNLYEISLQRAVDFGHTWSPLLEVNSGYRIPHGEAVGLDIAYSCALSYTLGLIEESTLRDVRDLYRAAGMTWFHASFDDLSFCEAAISQATEHRGGFINLPLPTGIGEHRFVETATELPSSLLISASRMLCAVD